MVRVGLNQDTNKTNIPQLYLNFPIFIDKFTNCL